ncbi:MULTISPECIES: beta-propeller fold lactonase family protein [Streptomyces]|uniref:lactonase family protein n=1 Tax=Streptomyces TaxID=1883 RepID=UPI001163804A|nr:MULTISPECIES: beta-propeller fold lactonase family protein [Streptomyces]MCX4612397.1 lactonase family protein [Streptomyces mirabilis]MCX5352622.1 lactonase family protein [Streptomyces mirabilis]NMI61583.1 lactonase family protein [Streptomyces sp. RLA2-12]QDN60670.1 lactonase family protein [Streptomyces sp. S1D4-20]QDN70724.1 lactonase family protein [Streptomyces sp. S1D4-14]
MSRHNRRRSPLQVKLTLVGAGILAAAAAVTTVTVASAGEVPRGHDDAGSAKAGADHAVFVQGNELDGNTIHVFKRARDGRLSSAGTYATGGKGGDQVDAPTDSLASQGSLVYDDRSGLLLAVNAGSGTVTSFRVEGQRLTDRRVVRSGGDFPSSIAVSGRLAYVMNAGGAGSVQGFRITAKGLEPLRDAHRSLGLDNKRVPLFSSSPGQVAFTPGGRELVVTTKSANSVEVFPMTRDGRPARRAVVNDSAGAVPFAITFDKAGRMLVAEAKESTVSTYRVRVDGILEVVQKSLPNGQNTLCWLERAGDFFYGGNTGNSTVTGYRTDRRGRLALTNDVGVAAPPSAESQGVIDLAVTKDEKFLYVQNATSGTVDGFRIGRNGSLTKVGTTPGLPPFAESGMEGIAAV